MNGTTDKPDAQAIMTDHVDYLLGEMRKVALNADPKYQNLKLASLFALLIEATTTRQLANRPDSGGN